MIALPTAKRPTKFIGSSKQDLSAMPDTVKEVFGFAIYQAQIGGKHLDAKPLKGFGGSSVVEVVESFEGDAYRAVYTVKFKGVVYVLHCFQKKSAKGARTNLTDVNLIKSRFKDAETHYRKHYAKRIAV
jgi:phage-related protein